jgi:hypothetical protein
MHINMGEVRSDVEYLVETVNFFSSATCWDNGKIITCKIYLEMSTSELSRKKYMIICMCDISRFVNTYERQLACCSRSEWNAEESRFNTTPISTKWTARETRRIWNKGVNEITVDINKVVHKVLLTRNPKRALQLFPHIFYPPYFSATKHSCSLVMR